MVRYMRVPQGSLIRNYLGLTKTSNKEWVSKSEVYEEIGLFLEGKHTIVAKHNCAKNRKKLDEVIEELQVRVKEKKYDKWKALDDIFERYFEITIGDYFD